MLSDICLPTSNINWKSTDGDYFYIDLSSVCRERNEIKPESFINRHDAPSRAQQIVKTNDVLFATTRPTLQRFCYIPSDLNEHICSTGFCVLRANEKYILSRYLFFIVSSNDFYTYVENNQEGTSYPSISNSKVKKYSIYLPSLEEQLKIVDILDRFDTLTTDISSGIPAEIDARKAQYEYYRNKLLSFD